ncbi:hypothetical protein PPL_00465 [Heterostelium album PN500]|uniref:Uncharacterized protein n=1 Tax=Heterostelium pallidum (strain ATCC 26659 / Pp 5 / PN500) TaxID=670386 RepID=D3AWJ0_HETP5|nr:hypothetical protein PPL_00465 [Heterostelium album PN500]EFA86663.1 hypothetical protein PPL_00465 [Heterostelium album PN500]|eukprot:XP_020438767.1 hypothetical protein PPL_00465 [Heterostelium album PN500]
MSFNNNGNNSGNNGVNLPKNSRFNNSPTGGDVNSPTGGGYSVPTPGRFHMRGSKKYARAGHFNAPIDHNMLQQQQQQQPNTFQQPIITSPNLMAGGSVDQLQQPSQLTHQQIGSPSPHHQHHPHPMQQQNYFNNQYQSPQGKPFGGGGRGGNSSSHYFGGGGRGGGHMRGGGRGAPRGRGRGGYRGGHSYFGSQSYHQGGYGQKMLRTNVNIPAFSGGAIIGVKGSLWGLINKATNARIKIIKTSAIIKCPDAQQLDRAKEIVLKLKNTAAKYLSLIDYKGEQKLKFVEQPNYSVVVLDNKTATDENTDIQDVARTHEPQFASRFNEIFSTLSIDKATQIPYVDIKTGKIWFIKCADIPSAAMSADKYELYTESLDSVFQSSSCINEQFVHQHTLFKEKKPYVLVTMLDTESLDIITVKCFEEKVVSPASPTANSSATPSSSTSTTSTTAASGNQTVEYRFINPSIYKQTHHINAKVLFPQTRQGHFDLRVSIDTVSKLPLDSHHENLRQFITSIKISKNANGNNNYSIPESNLFIVESLIIQKVSIYRNEQKTLQFHLLEDNVTRLTTSSPEYNRPTNSILCTSPSLYDMFKSKNWSIEQVLEEVKSLAKNVRILISQQDTGKLQTPPAVQSDFEPMNVDDDDEEEDSNNQ